MDIDRRTVLGAAPLLMARPAFAAEAPAPIGAYEAATGGRAGLYAENLDSGRKLLWRADERFIMCSTFKASLAACVLSRVDRGQERLDRRIPYGEKDLQPYAPVARENLAPGAGKGTGRGALSVEALCRGAVELSDNTCANLLLDAVGGPEALTAFWRRTGDRTSRLDAKEPELNRSRPGDPRNTTTPAAMASTLRALALGRALTPASRERLTTWMLNCRTGANRLRAGLPRGWMVGDKTGNNGADAAGDIAVAWPRPGAPVIVTLYTQGGAPKPEDLDRLFKGVGELVGARLG